MSRTRGGTAVQMTRMGLQGLLGSQVAPYLVPGILCGLSMPVALIAHWRWGDSPGMTAAMGAIATLITLGTYVTWGRRHEHTRNMAVIFAACVFGWIVAAASTNPLSSTMVNAWLLGGASLWTMWCIRYAALSVPHEDDKAEKATDPLFERISSLAGGRTRKIKETPGRVEATIKLKPGESTPAAVQADRERIASAVGMRADSVTATPVSGMGDDHVKLAFNFTDETKAAVKWKGASAPGMSVADAPVRPGVRADGVDLALWLCGKDDPDDPRPLSHNLCTGQTGSGKTETVKTVIIDGRWRRDFVPVVADPAKFAQSFGEIADTLAIAADGPEATARLIRNLPNAIRYRAQIFGELMRSDGTQGYAQWEPELWELHGIPLIFVDVEEAADLVEEDLDEIVRKARSVGIYLWVSLQTAIFANLERKTRGQFGQSTCHGTTEIQDAKFGLNANTINAGADPTKWGNTSPGCLYAEFTGTPQSEWAIEARSFYLTRAEKRAELAASKAAGYWAEMDPGTFDYLNAGISRPEVARTLVSEPAVEPDHPVLDMTKIETDEGEIDVTQPIPAPTGEPVVLCPPAANEMTTEQARAAVEKRIDELEASGQDTVGYGDLRDLQAVVGKSRPWFYGELRRLVDVGRLEESIKPPYRIRARVSNGHRAAV